MYASIWLYIFRHVLNPVSANPSKWSNTLQQFVGKLPTNCLNVFDHFWGLALKGMTMIIFRVLCICHRQSQCSEAVVRRYSTRKVFLNISQNSRKNTYNETSRRLGLQLYLKKTPVKVSYCEFCKIFKNTFFAEHLRTTASECWEKFSSFIASKGGFHKIFLDIVK